MGRKGASMTLITPPINPKMSSLTWMKKLIWSTGASVFSASSTEKFALK